MYPVYGIYVRDGPPADPLEDPEQFARDDCSAHHWRKEKLKQDWKASFAENQFYAQRDEERARLVEEAHDSRRPAHHRIGEDFARIAEQSVKKSWIKQGIWRNKWQLPPSQAREMWIWKHQEPSGYDSPPAVEPRGFFRPPEPKDGEPQEPPAPQLGRDASRPFHQFMYQVSQERHQMERSDPSFEHGVEMGYKCWHHRDLNTTAYQRVKDRWIKRGIWYHRWGVLPGMSWMHELPLGEIWFEELGPDPPGLIPMFNYRAKKKADDKANATQGKPPLLGPLEPAPVASSLPGDDTRERAREEPDGSGPSSPLPSPSRQTEPEKSLRGESMLPPVRRTGRLRPKRKAGADDASDEPAEPHEPVAEPKRNLGRNKRRRRGT
ncbi:hypothetical protein ACHAPT_011185 [Fusarium lateritium]